MFKKCLINQALIQCESRGKSIDVCHRYLKRFYGLTVSLKSLRKRFVQLKLSGMFFGKNTLINNFIRGNFLN